MHHTPPLSQSEAKPVEENEIPRRGTMQIHMLNSPTLSKDPLPFYFWPKILTRGNGGKEAGMDFRVSAALLIHLISVKLSATT